MINIISINAPEVIVEDQQKKPLGSSALLPRGFFY